MIYPVYIYCKRNFRNLHQKSEIFIIISYPPLHANFSKVVTPFNISFQHRAASGRRQLFRQLSPVIPQLFPQDLWKTDDFSEDLSTTAAENQRFPQKIAASAFSTKFTFGTLDNHPISDYHVTIRYRMKGASP